MSYQAVNFASKLGKFDAHWTPKVIAELSSQVVPGSEQVTYQFKLAKIKGEFVWHQHEHTDEVFVVLDGEMKIEFADGAVALKAGEMYVVPRGTSHRPQAAEECSILLIESSGVVNTGAAGGGYTAPNDVWI